MQPANVLRCLIERGKGVLKRTGMGQVQPACSTNVFQPVSQGSCSAGNPCHFMLSAKCSISSGFLNGLLLSSRLM